MWHDLGLAPAVSGDRPDERLRLGADRDRRLSPDAARCCRIGTPRRLCVVGRHADGACTPSSRTVAGADARRESRVRAVRHCVLFVWASCVVFGCWLCFVVLFLGTIVWFLCFLISIL